MKQRFIQVNPDQSLSVAEQALRTISDHEVLIEVQAFGINRPDLLQRSGLYPPPAGASPILGLEVAGCIIATGKHVTHWRTGDRVCALVNGGGYSNVCFAHAGHCLPWPAGYSAPEAACLPEALFTVWHNLFQRGKLQAGQQVLIQAGSSGIGTTAIQLATLAGACVTITAGTDDKCARCITLGAQHAINYTLADTFDRLQAAAPQGFDVILDVLGGNMLAQHMTLAANEGHIVQIAVLQGSKAGISLADLMLKRLTLTGSTLRAQGDTQKSMIANDILTHAWHWIETGAFRPVIDSVWAFDQVDAAHQHMRNRQHVGKMAICLLQ